MSADVNLSSDDMPVECLLEQFELDRVANKSSDPVSLEERLTSSSWRWLDMINQQET